MLRTLRIRNLAIIEDLTVEFGPGLNVLSGETGAGKSILVDALGLVAGDRADRSMVRRGGESTVVEGLFELPPSHPARPWCEEAGVELDDDDALAVRREVRVEGAGRVSVNGSPVTVGMLRALGERLLELHGQHESLELRRGERQLALLDGFGGHRKALGAVGEACRALGAAVEARRELERMAADRERRGELLRRTVQTVDALEPEPGELDRLSRERRLLRSAGRIAELVAEASERLDDGEPAAVALVADAARALDELAGLDDTLVDDAARLRGCLVELQDLVEGVRAYGARGGFDPARVEQVESRHASIERVCLELGEDEAGLLARRDEAREALAQLDDLDAALGEAREAERSARAGYDAAAGTLGRARRRTATALARAVSGQLADLALAEASFGVRLVRRAESGTPTEPDPRGDERAVFEIAANPGEPARPLHQAASGGELSRVLLALHVSADPEGDGRTMVFDEVDSGVGGPVADAVGSRLGRLSRGSQVLCVTHLPQVAAHADRHLHVSKQVVDGRTRGAVEPLDADGRIDELARMLGGRRPSASSRTHAEELIRAAARSAAGSAPARRRTRGTRRVQRARRAP